MTRGDVLQAARHLFSEYGFNGTSMRDIARHLGSSLSAIYNYFPTKQDILLAILDRPIADLTARIEEAIGEGEDPLDRFLRAYRIHVRHYLESPIVAAMFHAEAKELSPEHQASFNKMRERYERLFKEALAACVAAGQVRQCDSRVLMNILFGVPVPTTRWFNPGRGLSIDEMTDFILDFVIHAIQPRPR